MIEILAMILAVLLVIAVLIFMRVKSIKVQVKQGLWDSQQEEEQTENVKIIETGSNFKTRMTDFKKDLDLLNSSIEERNEIVRKFREGGNA